MQRKKVIVEKAAPDDCHYESYELTWLTWRLWTLGANVSFFTPCLRQVAYKIFFCRSVCLACYKIIKYDFYLFIYFICSNFFSFFFWEYIAMFIWLINVSCFNATRYGLKGGHSIVIGLERDDTWWLGALDGINRIWP